MTLENGRALVRLPIRDAHVPNVYLAVAVHAEDGTSGRNSASVRVAPRTRELDVSVTPRAATTIAVAVMDAAGEPVAGADVVLSGIDEALAALSRRGFRDPLDEIYQRSRSEVFNRTLRTHIAPQLTPAPRLAGTDAGPQAVRVRRGARVRIRLTVAAPGPRHHVAVIDPLPAGLEAINPSLAGTTRSFAVRDRDINSQTPTGAPSSPFFAEHVNVKADRFEA